MMKRLVCHTYICPNKDVEYLWDYDTDMAQLQQDGEAAGQQVIMATPTCGGCSQPYVDVSTDNSPSPGTGGIVPAPTT